MEHGFPVQLLIIREQGFPDTSFSSVTESCPSLRDPVDGSMPGLPVHHQLPELAHTHVH